MPGIFDEKHFNAEVFEGYVNRIPNTKRNALINSRAIRMRPDLAAAMKDGDGGNYITTTLHGLISGTTPQNYDGSTDITPGTTCTYRHSRVVVGRAASWTEKDFSYDVTGQDFMENIAQQVSEYWNEVDQDTLLHVLNGIFKMTGAENLKFVDAHTHNVTEVANSEGKTGYMDATTLNTAMQKACGDNKSSFALVCMHSVVATNLENLKLLSYLKYTDANGMEREVGLGTLNGRLVLIDDTMPVKDVAASGSGADAVPAHKEYTTYALGEGAIELTDCGVKVPYEVDRSPDKNGGQDTLYSRQRKCFAPFGISFTQKSMATLSPTDAELENGANWELVNSMATGAVKYIDHKSIPIARIISLG